MTCQELKSYWDELDSDVCELPAAALRHVSDCASCRNLVETRKEVLDNLRLLREATPAVAASLDAAVLARYREAMAAPALSTGSLWAKMTALRGFAAISATALVILMVIALIRRTPSPTEPHSQPLHAPEIARTGVPDPAKTQLPVTHRDGADVPEATARKRKRAVARHPAAVTPRSRPDDPQEFRSLMYCDELSCDGDMDVVRVQLPALPAGFLSAPNTSIRSVSADVLVGADGFARGIRIVR